LATIERQTNLAFSTDFIARESAQLLATRLAGWCGGFASLSGMETLS
jgi:hypothetical protein